MTIQEHCNQRIVVESGYGLFRTTVCDKPKNHADNPGDTGHRIYVGLERGGSKAGYHWRHGVYFNRSQIDRGAVDITVPDYADPSKSQVLSIPPNEWASIVASVSILGETAETYGIASHLHGEVTEQGAL